MAAPNPNAGIPWDQTPEYIALTDHVIPPGGQTTYTRFHPTGTSPTDSTAFVYGQRNVHIGNWPEVLYMLFPTAEWKAFKQFGPPQQKVDANQQAMFERWPRVGEQARPLLDFPILPDSISSREELWRFDVWRKMDPRMSWDDLTMRIEVRVRTQQGDLKLQNSIQTMLRRFWHTHYHMISWFGKGKNNYNTVTNPARVQLLNALANATPPIPVILNTTKGLTPGSINPAHGPNGTMVAWPNIRGGTIRGPPTAVAPAAVIAPPAVSVVAVVIPPIPALAPLPATASVAAVTEVNDLTGNSDRDEIRDEDEPEHESEGTEAFIESNGDSDDVEDAPASSLDTTSAISDKENEVSIEEVADSEGEWSSTDSSSEDAAADSFNPRQSFRLVHSTIPANIDTNSGTVNEPYAMAFAPINHATPVPANDEATAASYSSQPAAKRRRIGSGIYSNTNIHNANGAMTADTKTPAERIIPSFQPSSSPMTIVPPAQTQGLVNSSEAYRQPVGFPDITATDNDSTTDTNVFFEESGELPPDGSFY